MNDRRLLLTTVAAFVLLGGMLALLNGPSQVVKADPGTLCVAPGGSACNPATCGTTCYASVQAAVDAAVTGDEIRVAAGTYTGVQARGGMAQVVYISKTVTVRGGYNGALTAWDPDTYATVLDAQAQGRVVSIVGPGIAATLEGLTITGGNAHGLTAHCPSVGGPADGCGGGVLVYDAGLTMTRSVVTHNVAADPTTGPRPTGYGGGLCLVSAHGSVIAGNLIVNNAASLDRTGMGGGIHIHVLDYGLVASNQVLSNTATMDNSHAGWGGGIAVTDDVTGGIVRSNRVEGNQIEGNRTNGEGSGEGAGLYQWYGATRFSGNRVSGNHGQHAVYLGHSQSRFEANQVVDNDTAIGLALQNSYAAAPMTATNNVVVRSGDRTVWLKAYSGDPLDARLIHNTLIGLDGGCGVYVDSGYVTVHLTNTIVANHAWGITNTFPASSTVTADHTLFWGNDQDGIVGTNPVYGDPLFIDFGMGGSHLLPGSAAIDAGVDAGEDFDIDGQSRPLGLAPDIGADEAGRWMFAPLVLRDND
jgi:hypothetical protein